MSPSDYWQSAEGARTLSASVQIKTSCCVLELAGLLADALGTWTGLRGSYCIGLQMVDHHAAALIPKLEPQLAHAWLSSAHRQGVKHPQPAHTAATCAMGHGMPLSAPLALTAQLCAQLPRPQYSGCEPEWHWRLAARQLGLRIRLP